MQQNVAGAEGLERSCGPAGADWLRTAPPAPGIERIEAFFRGRAYAPHRHDTYAIGYTMAGVQCFDYGGGARTSLPGQIVALHPDERHDGRAGTGAGFRYRMLYIDSGAARRGARRLRTSVRSRRRIDRSAPAPRRATRARRFPEPVEELRRTEILDSLARALAAVTGGAEPARPVLDLPALSRARAVLRAPHGRAPGNDALERASGLDRWSLARQFRAAYGTSPYRYFAMRRLERARALIRGGAPLAEAALAAGFADQSHMTRQFTRAYGLPPGRWAALAAVP
ncbi:MAG: AraC family transcriptional regulator [Alphaproteobacteria bacterium]